MTIAEAIYQRFQELSRTNPPDLSKHREDAERLAVKRGWIEDSQGTRDIPARKVYCLTFGDGSQLKIVMTSHHRDVYRWVDASIEAPKQETQ